MECHLAADTTSPSHSSNQDWGTYHAIATEHLKNSANKMDTGTSAEPAEKRPKTTAAKSWEDISCQEFVSFTNHYMGPMVKITVKEKQYQLPRKLLCYWSPVFNAAFSGVFKEGQEQAIKLETSTDAFELVIRWLFTGTVVLSSSKLGADIITQLISFVKLAHFLGIEDSSPGAVAKIRDVIINSPDCLVGHHIRDAFELPSDHPLPVLITEACVLPYIKSLEKRNCRKPFKFQEEIVKVGDFGNRLFQCYDKVFRARTRSELNRGKAWYADLKDPLTGTTYSYSAGEF